ncbi:MAG: hypothetical protein V8R46_03920 [Eubacterium ramulus]
MSIATLAAFPISDYPEAVGVMLFYRVGELFEDIAVSSSRSQIMDAVDMRPEVVNMVAGNDILVIPAEEACIGDILLVRPGDRIPLDGIIVEGESRIWIPHRSQVSPSRLVYMLGMRLHPGV